MDSTPSATTYGNNGSGSLHNEYNVITGQIIENRGRDVFPQVASVGERLNSVDGRVVQSKEFVVATSYKCIPYSTIRFKGRKISFMTQYIEEQFLRLVDYKDRLYAIELIQEFHSTQIIDK